MGGEAKGVGGEGRGAEGVGGEGGEFTLLSFFSFILKSIFCFVSCFCFFSFSGVRCVIWTVAGRRGKNRVFFYFCFYLKEMRERNGLAYIGSRRLMFRSLVAISRSRWGVA